MPIFTVRELFDTFASRTKPGRSPVAETERRRNRAEFLAVAGDRLLADLIPDDLEGWIESHQSWDSEWTRLRVSNAIKRPFNWALRKGLIQRNPFASVSFRPGPRGKPISKADFLKMLRGSPLDLRQILYFLSVTGARPGELCDLEWTFIAEDGTATLHTHKTCHSRRDGAPRVIVLPSAAIALLVRLRRRQEHGEKYPFLNRRGGKLDRGALDLRIWRLRRRLGIPKSVKLYGVRHAWATNLAKAKVDLFALMELLGHTTLDMAKHYIHLAGQNEFLRSELERGLKGSKGR